MKRIEVKRKAGGTGLNTTSLNTACKLSFSRGDYANLESILYFNLTLSPLAAVLELPTALDIEHPLFKNDKYTIPYVNMAVSSLEAAVAGRNAKITYLDNKIIGLLSQTIKQFLVVFMTKFGGN
ncbi:hypothetical protein J3E69DRAFT_360905 [Trichoderma sp. SZMC 28015]